MIINQAKKKINIPQAPVYPLQNENQLDCLSYNEFERLAGGHVYTNFLKCLRTYLKCKH